MYIILSSVGVFIFKISFIQYIKLFLIISLIAVQEVFIFNLVYDTLENVKLVMINIYIAKLLSTCIFIYCCGKKIKDFKLFLALNLLANNIFCFINICIILFVKGGIPLGYRNLWDIVFITTITTLLLKDVVYRNKNIAYKNFILKDISRVLLLLSIGITGVTSYTDVRYNLFFLFVIIYNEFGYKTEKDNNLLMVNCVLGLYNIAII